MPFLLSCKGLSSKQTYFFLLHMHFKLTFLEPLSNLGTQWINTELDIQFLDNILIRVQYFTFFRLQHHRKYVRGYFAIINNLIKNNFIIMINVISIIIFAISIILHSTVLLVSVATLFYRECLWQFKWIEERMKCSSINKEFKFRWQGWKNEQLTLTILVD